MVSLSHLLKRVIRPMVPDRIMARYRLHQHSRHSRTNVDVFLDDPRMAGRWLSTTPDTYRARLTRPEGEAPEGLVLVEDESHPVSDKLRSAARSLMVDPDLGAAVVGEVAPPRLVDRRRTEPVIGPRLVVLREEALAEVGGVPGGDHPLPGLLARLRDAGHRIGLIPVPRSDAPVERTDPIDGHSIVILAAVPMHDVGGGARSTQLALTLLREGFHVTLVSLYDAQETVDLGLRFIHPRLEKYRISEFDADLTIRRSRGRGTVLLEAPAAPLVEAAFALQRNGWQLIYDSIDDWSDPALGAEWYRPDLEEDVVRRAARVIASAPDLVDRAATLGRPDATLIPNAVNAEVFGVDLLPHPDDLPRSEIILGYHGSLYGDWFDWRALRRVAEAHPDATVVLIGDPKRPMTDLPANVHFLGLKPQTALPAYVQRFDVGLIPFRVSDTTHAVSPLKAYEYLASGVPVAAPPLRTLQGLDGVFVDDDLVAAVGAAMTGTRPDRAVSLSEHSWEARVALLELDHPARSGDREVVMRQRPPVHHPRGSRLA